MGLLAKLTGNATAIAPGKAKARFGAILVEGERIILAFEHYRDAVVLTDRRFIEANLQGLTGKKKEVLSVPWKHVNAFSTESAGHLDLDSELKLWVSGMERPKGIASIQCRLAPGTDVEALQRFMAEVTCAP